MSVRRAAADPSTRVLAGMTVSMQRTPLRAAADADRHASAERLDSYAPEAYGPCMLTVVETLLFQKQWPLYWTEEERGEFAVV